jgi:hypothetical protein
MSPTDPAEGGPRPQVYARLANEAERRALIRRAPAWSVWAGRLLVVAIIVMVFVVAVRIQPWS